AAPAPVPAPASVPTRVVRPIGHELDPTLRSSYAPVAMLVSACLDADPDRRPDAPALATAFDDLLPRYRANPSFSEMAAAHGHGHSHGHGHTPSVSGSIPPIRTGVQARSASLRPGRPLTGFV